MVWVLVDDLVTGFVTLRGWCVCWGCVGGVPWIPGFVGFGFVHLQLRVGCLEGLGGLLFHVTGRCVLNLAQFNSGFWGLQGECIWCGKGVGSFSERF